MTNSTFDRASEIIAVAFGYTPFPEEDRDKQFQAEVNYNPDKDKLPKSGSTYRTKRGKLMIYWAPSEEHPNYGWYDVPTNGEVEEECLGEVALDPVGENELEPDHPDGWPRLLGLI
jgi:hypothetical protein